MKKLLHLKAILLMLCLSVVGGGMTSATAQTVVFQETFSKANDTGGNDGQWNGNQVGNGTINALDDVTDIPG